MTDGALPLLADLGVSLDEPTGKPLAQTGGLLYAGPGDTVPDDASSTATLATGQSIAGAINIGNDHDWYRVSLVAGQRYQFRTVTAATSDLDTTLTLRSSAGTQLAFNDDSQGSTDSLLTFTPTTSGTYYIDVGSYEQESLGEFTLSMSLASTLGVYSNDQIATQLASNYWGAGAHRFNVSPGGTLSVNITGLTAAGQSLAVAALDLWTDATGIRFSQTSGSAQITFDDDREGASTGASYSGGITSSARVNVSTQWLSDFGTGPTSYSMQTYVHEIGHALGLGHGGDYNDDADYPDDALYLNDSWSTTIMSYFDQRENTFFSGQGFTRQFTVTPMAADILAVQQLYGVATTTRTGNTTYGFNNNSGRAVFDAPSSAVAYTIVDNGGNDTLDYSGYSSSQRIDLMPEAFSNVGGRVGNVVIARGTVIENVISGAGADIIGGNSANNLFVGGGGADSMWGWAGNDTFRGTLAEMAGDRINDFAVGDRISLVNLNYSTAAASLSFDIGTGVSTFNAAGTSTNILLATGVQSSQGIAANNYRLAVTQGGAGGTDFVAVNRYSGLTDFGGDGHSDILWQNANGSISSWGVAGNTNANQLNRNTFFAGVDASWKVIDTFDVDGDSRSDILWRNDNGNVSIWRSTGPGSFQPGYFNAGSPGGDWRIAGTGDINGDGRDDMLWQRNDGAISSWNAMFTSSSSGSVSMPTANSYYRGSPGAEWKIEGLADFDGDGKDDLLWRSNASGALSTWRSLGTGYDEYGFFDPSVSLGSGWQVAGLGDFQGDGRDDILWRNTNGAISLWQSNGSGGFAKAVYNGFVGTDWSIAQVGDFNDDGRADILWRNAGGAISIWQSNGSGFDQNTLYDGGASTDWQIQSHEGYF